jgi:Na+/glutamate symporter
VTVKAAKATVARNPCASTSVTISTVLALVFWIAGREGVDLPLWIGSLITGIIVSASLTFSSKGLFGIWRAILYGTGQPEDES